MGEPHHTPRGHIRVGRAVRSSGRQGRRYQGRLGRQRDDELSSVDPCLSPPWASLGGILDSLALCVCPCVCYALLRSQRASVLLQYLASIHLILLDIFSHDCVPHSCPAVAMAKKSAIHLALVEVNDNFEQLCKFGFGHIWTVCRHVR